jgi:bla regulator protein blaR1
VIEPFALKSRSRCLALAVWAALAGLTLPVHAPAAAAADSADRNSYVLLAPGSRSATMSGSTDDLNRARSLRTGDEALLYARVGGISYVIRDRATIARARSLFEPQEKLGARQAELGSRQAALGARQGRLGAEQARLGVQQAAASPRRANELGRQQNELGRQQNALGEQQNLLGKEQNVLGREQNRLARVADEQLRGLLAQAIRSGVAQRVD